MEIEKYEDINAIKLDIIKEIGSIGNGNAATALSSMLNAQVSMKLPEVSVLGFNEAIDTLGNPEDIVAAVLVELSGEISGIMLFILTKDFAQEVLHRTVGSREVELTELNELHTSVLTEIGNIVISTYINALSSLTQVNVHLSIPQMAVNMLGGILSLPMASAGMNSDKIMMITGQFEFDGKRMNSDMLLLPDVHSLNVLMKKLGVD